jgi:hypothetical protein
MFIKKKNRINQCIQIHSIRILSGLDGYLLQVVLLWRSFSHFVRPHKPVQGNLDPANFTPLSFNLLKSSIPTLFFFYSFRNLNRSHSSTSYSPFINGCQSMASHSPIASQSAVSPNPRSSAKSKASDDARLKRLKVGRACFTCRQKKIKVSII